MSQERRKKLLNLNPALKLMANDEVFKSAAPMLFGDEFVSKATNQVEQLKAITKVATKPDAKKPGNHFFGYYPRTYPSTGCGGGNKSSQGRFQPLGLLYPFIEGNNLSSMLGLVNTW